MSEPPATPPAGTPPAATPGGNNPQATPQPAGKMHSEDEVNSIVKDRLKRERETLEKEFGVPLKDAKSLIAAAKQAEESKKTDMEKLQGQIAERDKTILDLQGKLAGFELEKVKLQKLTAAGVSPDWLDSVTGGNEEEITASVTKIAGRLKAVPPVVPAAAQGAGNPGIPPRKEEPDIDQQIRDAQKAGNTMLAIQLNLKKQGLG